MGNREIVLLAASGSPLLTAEHCEMLYGWQKECPRLQLAKTMRENLARVPATPMPLLLEFVESGEDVPRINAIKSDRLPPPMVANLIAELAASKNWATKAFAASHPATSPKQLDSLAREGLAGQQYEYGVPNVCDTVARNPNTSLATLRMLEKQALINNFYNGLGANPKTSPETLLRIIDGRFGVTYAGIEAVIKNPNLPKEKMLEYAAPENESFHRDLSRNPALPLDVIQSFSTNKMAEIRAAIAANPNTPTDILQRLADDKSKYVREKAEEETERRENAAKENHP